LPNSEPYANWAPTGNSHAFTHVGGGGGETIVPGLLSVIGPDAIVDWVFVSIRSKADPTVTLATQSGLVQRDGDIVAATLPSDDYYVSVRHRNHLGVMSRTALTPIAGAITVDFTVATTPTYGNNAQRQLNTTIGTDCPNLSSNVMAMWAGDTDSDGLVILEGGGFGIPDKTTILFDVITHPNNFTGSTNFIAPGYNAGDTNLDGSSRAQGLANDIDEMIFFNILVNDQNTSQLMNYVIQEQLPE